MNILNWMKDNVSWVFSGIGVAVISAIWAIIKFFVKKDKGITNSYNKTISATAEKNSMNVAGDNNNVNNSTVNNYYLGDKVLTTDVKESDFSKRYLRLKELLNQSNGIRDKEYTDEYISSLLGLSNVKELHKYINTNETPSDSFKEKFVEVFGVNKEWMLYGQGDRPFKSNKKYCGNDPIEIIQEGFLKPEDRVILVIGEDEDKKRKALFIIKHNEELYEVIHKEFHFDANVGATGTRLLVNLYDVIQKLENNNVLINEVYIADDKQTKALYEGTVAPKEIHKCEIFRGFLGLFLDISPANIERNKSFLDEGLIDVQKIISNEKGYILEHKEETASSTAIFSDRFAFAFPGIRETLVIDKPDECVKRLETLLAEPIESNKIWMLRGTSSEAIDSCQLLSGNKILINGCDEFKVKKIHACYSRSYYKKFVYVETEPEKQSGAYNYTQDEIDYYVSKWGYAHEEYALYKGKAITRPEYDDGAAIINGKAEKLNGGAELRVRYLTPYNFIICAQFNPLGDDQYELQMEKYLNGILSGCWSVDDISRFVETLPKHTNNYL